MKMINKQIIKIKKKSTMVLKNHLLSWKLKVIVQFILAYLPLGEKINHSLQNLYGCHSPEKIKQRIIPLLKRIVPIGEFINLKDCVVLEIGTGWHAISPLLFYLIGAKTIYTYDHVAHVRYKLLKDVIKLLENEIEQIHKITLIPKSILMNRLIRIKQAKDIKTLFKIANIMYKAPADATKTELDDNSVDLVYSHAVLEHIPEKTINELIIETKRILKKNGVAYHLIGLHDHYNFDKKVSRVNFLKYPECIWKFFVKNKISYHNRLREKEFIGIFKSHGAKIEMVKSRIDPKEIEILKTMKIDKRFSNMGLKELAIYQSEFILSWKK